MEGFPSMLSQLVRPTGLPDLWLGGPSTVHPGRGLCGSHQHESGSDPRSRPLPSCMKPQRPLQGGHQWFVCRHSPGCGAHILGLNLDLLLPGGILQGPLRPPYPDPQRRVVCPITQWQTGFPEGTPIYEGEETCSLRGAQNQVVGGRV